LLGDQERQQLLSLLQREEGRSALLVSDGRLMATPAFQRSRSDGQSIRPIRHSPSSPYPLFQWSLNQQRSRRTEIIGGYVELANAMTILLDHCLALKDCKTAKAGMM
jgi:hypothetical protein